MDINKVNIKKIDNCPCCKKSMKVAIDLPQFPLTEFYEDFEEDKFEDKGYLDQKLLFCNDCSHASLSNIIDVEYIYDEKNYLTNTVGSAGAVKCLDNFYEFIKKNTKNFEFDNVIDIGGNDGYLLKLFSDKKHKINIDPNARYVDGVDEYKIFFEDIDANFLNQFEKKLIVSSHTFEHVADPVRLMTNISDLIKKNEMFIIQLPSIEKLVQHKKFEQLCHQHLNYFSKKSLFKVFQSFGLKILDFEYDEAHFGTIRIAGLKDQKKGLTFDNNEALTLGELKDSFEQYKTYMNIINQNIISAKNINGFGAGLMVPVLYYFLPALKMLNNIYDENNTKNGKRFINLNVPIKKFSQNIDVTNQDIIITSITTKSAARAILKKLTDLGVKNIICPVMYL